MCQMPGHKSPFYYALLMKGNYGNPFMPVAEMVTADNTSTNIAAFLIKLHGKHKYIPKVEIDLSWALLTATVRCFNTMSVIDYIE